MLEGNGSERVVQALQQQTEQETKVGQGAGRRREASEKGHDRMAKQKRTNKQRNQQIAVTGKSGRTIKTSSGQALSFFLAIKTVEFLTKSLWPVTCCVGFYFAYLATGELAGKTTDANILANVGISWGWDKMLAFAFGIGGILYGNYERRLRIRSLATERDRNQRYEDAADPDRTTSGLLPGGVMPTED